MRRREASTRHLLVAFVFALCVGAGACSNGGPASSHDGGALPDGGFGPHPTPGAGQAAAWQITSASDLIPGPATHGKVGDWMIANGRVRFIIEGNHASDGYDSYGGNIVAADRQRTDGGGESRWGEAFLGLNFRAPGCSSVQLVDDGSGGDAAELLVTGSDEVSPFMASVFAEGFEPPDLHATITRDYSLAPDSDALLMTMTVQNNGDAAFELKEPYIGMAMNRGLRHWLPQSGFDMVNLNPSAEFYAAVGDQISYSVIDLNDSFAPIIDFAKVLIGQYPEATVQPGQGVAFRFAIAVGNGDVGSLQAAHAELRGALSQAVTLSGTVRDPNGNPVAGTRVHIANAAAPSTEISFARSDANGAFSAAIAPGNYTLSAVDDAHPFLAAKAITLTQSGLQNVVLQVGGTATISVSASDVNGPIPAKIVAEPDAANPRTAFPDSYDEPGALAPAITFSPDGNATLQLAPGKWKVTVSRGFEYDVAISEVTVAPGGNASVSAVLHRVVDTTGWQSGDFHIHAQDSPDVPDLRTLKVAAFAAEGVEIPVQTDHEWVGDFTPTVNDLGLGAFMHAIAGTEMTTTFLGHFNIFPLLPDSEQVNQGAFAWYGRQIPDVIAEARTRIQPGGLVPFVQMNHPRTTGMDYLGAVGFSPALFAPDGAQALQFTTAWDAMEIWNGFPLSQLEGCPTDGSQVCTKVDLPTQNDWFAFLSRGMHIVGTGNSDSHTASTDTVGYPRNFVLVGTDDPGALTDAKVIAALQAGHSTMSGGPFLLISALDASGNTVGIGDLAATQMVNGQQVVQLKINVQAPTWMGPMSRVDIWIGNAVPMAAQPGTLVRSLDLTKAPYLDDGTKVVRLATTINVPMTADNWILASVRGPSDDLGNSNALWPVVQTTVPPFAMTNPIWIDADGDGISSPVLSQ